MKNVGLTIRNIFKEILRGELLLHLKVDRYFIHIIYTFFLFGLIIWISLMIDSSMAKVEDNKKVLEGLEIIHAQKTYEVVSLSKRSSVEKRLEELGSDVKEAERPATMLKK